MNELPRSFGRYQLVELLATGGMAHVYRARLAVAGGVEKELVIKQVLPHLARNRDFIDMFVDEARITLPLTHGNIVQVYEFGQVGDDYYLAMEYVRGRNLETVLERLRRSERSMPVELALFVAAEVARGLDYAHRFRDQQDRPLGIIHRDVSPQNVLVGFHGEVKLTDFGIAKARSRIHATAQGVIRGKACYLSPEQAECQDLDARSDIFSLGIVLYEMLTGRRPFEGENEVATLDNIRAARPRAPSVDRPGLLPQVDGVVLKALNREPERRFESAAAMQVALANALRVQAPDCNAAQLAEWMRELFAEEISQEIEVGAATAERLRRQLERHGREAGSLATGEMLAMGTLEIRRQGQQPVANRPRRLLVGMLVVVMLAALALGGWWWWQRANPIVLADAGPATIDGTALAADATAARAPSDPDGAAGGDRGAASTDAGTAVVRDGGGSRADRRRQPVGFAYLDLNSRPWSQVWLDGRRLEGETPIFGVKVRAGQHRLRFFNPKLNIEKTKVIRVEAGQRRKVIVELTGP